MLPDTSSVVITGTGWSSDLEHQARKLAFSRNIPSVAVLDHWVNYRERFKRNGTSQLPGELWVSDAEAATFGFPNVPENSCKAASQLPLSALTCQGELYPLY